MGRGQGSGRSNKGGGGGSTGEKALNITPTNDQRSILYANDGKYEWLHFQPDDVRLLKTQEDIWDDGAKAFMSRVKAANEELKEAYYAKRESTKRQESAEERSIRKQKERDYDKLYNEGGEGFNPYRD